MKPIKKTKDELIKLCIMNGIDTERIATGYIPYKFKYYDKKKQIVEAEYWSIIFYNIEDGNYNIDQILRSDITKFTKGRRVIDVTELPSVNYIVPNSEHSIFNINVSIDKLLDLNFVEDK